MSKPEEILQKLLIKIAKENKYEPATTEIKSISSGGANYTSDLFTAVISTSGKNNIDIFAKVAVLGEKMRAIQSANIYIREIYFYNNLLTKYQELEEKYKVPKEHRLVTPILYGSDSKYLKEILVLENLFSKGYEQFDRFKAINWNYAKESIKQLTKLHALSFAYSKDDPVEFEKSKTLLITDMNFEAMRIAMSGLVNNAIEVVNEENKERFSRFIQNRLDCNSFNDFFKTMRCSVIIHGDYRPSNLMHKVNEDGTYDIIPLDFQTIRHGSPVVDLFYFILTGSDKKFRENHFTNTIDLYYSELCNAMRRLGVDPNEVYKREDFDYEFKDLLPLGLTLCVFTLFFITVETDKAPKPSEDFRLEDFQMKANEFYKERINGIIEDFIKMDIL